VDVNLLEDDCEGREVAAVLRDEVDEEFASATAFLAES